MEYEPQFDSTSNLSSCLTKYPLPVVAPRYRGGNKSRATIFSRMTCLWDIGDTGSMVKSKHNYSYKHKLGFNKVEYITAVETYCTTHDVKVPFCMPKFSSSKIISHWFHTDNDKGESGIGYDVIIGRDLMVQLGLTANFKQKSYLVTAQ